MWAKNGEKILFSTHIFKHHQRTPIEASGKEKSMKKQLGKVPYEEAKLDVVLLDSLDVITTSVTMGDGEDTDASAWT